MAPSSVCFTTITELLLALERTLTLARLVNVRASQDVEWMQGRMRDAKMEHSSRRKMLERDLDKERELSAHANELTTSNERLRGNLTTTKREALERKRGEAETKLVRAREAHAAEVKRVLDEVASSKSSIAQMITQFKVQFSTLMEEKDQLAMTLDDEDQCKCVVCKESRKEYAFLPCGHMCVCEGCAASIQGQDCTCPLCRGVSTSIMKIFH
jgi:hypothetical protein